MAKIEVTINGTNYPCRLTMGAMLRFKQETGKEVTEMSDNNLTELCAYLYCCVASACSADKVEFNMSLMDFADALSPADMNTLATQLQGGTTADTKAEKKT